MVQRFLLFGNLLRNLIDYPLRQLFRWRRKGLRLKYESKDGLYDHLTEPNRGIAQTAAQRYLIEYRLESFYSRNSQENYRENLYYLAMIESALTTANVALPDKISAADIGPSHWFYVQALYAALKWWHRPAGREVTLTGYEGDAYRIYTDFFSRYDHALAHIARLPGVEYKPCPFRAQPAAFDVITLFFPFIFMPDHLEWGLPSSMFDPSALLSAAWLSLKPGGLLIIVNQGKDEQQKQLELCNQAGIPVSASFPFDSMLYQYDIQRFITITRCEHNAQPPG